MKRRRGFVCASILRNFDASNDAIRVMMTLRFSSLKMHACTCAQRTRCRCDFASINRIVVRLLFVSNDSSQRLETSNKTQLQFWWLYLFHIYNEFITDEATISIPPLIRCNPIVFVYFNLTMLRARDFATRFDEILFSTMRSPLEMQNYQILRHDRIHKVFPFARISKMEVERNFFLR